MKLITNDDIEIEFDKIKTIEIKENEVVVLRIQQRLTEPIWHNLMKSMGKIFPNNKVIILEEGAEIVSMDSKVFCNEITKEIKLKGDKA